MLHTLHWYTAVHYILQSSFVEFYMYIGPKQNKHIYISYTYMFWILLITSVQLVYNSKTKQHSRVYKE